MPPHQCAPHSTTNLHQPTQPTILVMLSHRMGVHFFCNMIPYPYIGVQNPHLPKFRPYVIPLHQCAKYTIYGAMPCHRCADIIKICLPPPKIPPPACRTPIKTTHSNLPHNQNKLLPPTAAACPSKGAPLTSRGRSATKTSLSNLPREGWRPAHRNEPPAASRTSKRTLHRNRQEGDRGDFIFKTCIFWTKL